MYVDCGNIILASFILQNTNWDGGGEGFPHNYSDKGLKGLWAKFKVTLHGKMAMPDLQRYPWNFIRIKNVEDTVIFLTRKVFISVSFSNVSYKQFAEKSQMKINSLKNKKTFIPNSYLIRQSFQMVPLYIGRWHLCMEAGGLLEITLLLLLKG